MNQMNLFAVCIAVFVATTVTAAGYDEARVRYIMADITTGGPLGYYRGHPNDAHAVEAVSRWDQGVRVVNGTAFERIILEEKGWTIVYAGTLRAIDGMDVVLTTDRVERARPKYDEARVRYIMADITTGGALGYYEGFPDDAHAVEAVRRWKAGVRVRNQGSFPLCQDSCHL
jgi:hypothetical protein